MWERNALTSYVIKEKAKAVVKPFYRQTMDFIPTDPRALTPPPSLFSSSPVWTAYLPSTRAPTKSLTEGPHAMGRMARTIAWTGMKQWRAYLAGRCSQMQVCLGWGGRYTSGQLCYGYPSPPILPHSPTPSPHTHIHAHAIAGQIAFCHQQISGADVLLLLTQRFDAASSPLGKKCICLGVYSVWTL